MRPIAKIGKRHNAKTRDSRHFTQNMFSMLHGLQRLGQHHCVELLIIEQGQAFLQILLNHLHPPSNSGDDVIVVKLDPGADNLLCIR